MMRITEETKNNIVKVEIQVVTRLRTRVCIRF